jgi:hypothetical protein
MITKQCYNNSSCTVHDGGLGIADWLAIHRPQHALDKANVKMVVAVRIGT